MSSSSQNCFIAFNTGAKPLKKYSQNKKTTTPKKIPIHDFLNN